MNNKECVLCKIIDIVVSCCATPIDENGTMSVTKDEVLGKSRSENAVMTRCVLVSQIIGAGYSTTTVANLLHRTPHAIRHILDTGYKYQETSRAYQIAHAEATLKCKDILP